MKVLSEIWLVRHGETEWSLSGAHTSRTDIPLTEQGKERAVTLKPYLARQDFSLVLTSPRQRAQETCKLAGMGDQAEVDANLAEWDYGIYEGRTTPEIRKEHPGWSVWNDPIPEGESLPQVAARAEKVISKAKAAGGKVLIFSHAHFLRILTACWMELPPSNGKSLALTTGSLSILGYERETPVLRLWNRSFETSL
ncbi:histidine phosphatase family protein [Terriglobus saanensis]|uniref:Phosphoglycerate mutase n=1 Tax=Terriglobus saanensis (strain ATCC BAA-1853 / DSM 23119 / SP1PR4) TaxID=401053 RepID=E8V8F6_TERSS|nr:histidine phosphatase family protein [Terriglobus saanensis]ADV82935.1 Phosphoglycerate mutase [Terriglobus saanensis SP1PR4]